MIDLTIIVPVYNVEKYISKCLDSIFSQVTKVIYEVIIVNDGTPDKSVDCIKPFLEKYSNCKLMNKENGGLSSARNLGMKYANGEYVWFVDSDDWVEEGSIDTIYNGIREKTDVIAFDAVFHTSNIQKRTLSNLDEGVSIKGFDFIKSNPIYSVWRFWYKREFLLENKIEFVNGLIHEDGDYNTRIFALAESVSYVKAIGYHYVTDHPQSIMNSISLKRACTGFVFLDLMDEFIFSHNFSKSNISYIAIDRMVALNGMFYPMFTKLASDDKKKFLSEMNGRKKQIARYLIWTRKLKYCLIIPFLYISSNLCIRMINLKRKNRDEK